MSCETASVDNFFVVRWGDPTDEDFDRVIAEVEQLRQSCGVDILYLGIMPATMSPIDDTGRKGFMRLTEGVLPHCKLLTVAFEARGFRGAIMRSAMTAVTLLTRRYSQLRFFDTTDAALEAGREHWLEDRTAMAKAITATGNEVPPCLGVAAA
jgi:hypothetical protein